MTARQLYEGVLIELHKENAPNILLEDFNYFANKSISQYINKRYNIYDVNQQTTDDLRVLKATAMLTPHKMTEYNDLSLANMATYYVDLPSDYLHILNCICIYKVKKTYKCYNKDDTWRAAATRLTADAYSQVLDNFWLKPTYKRPYFYIHNINTVNDGSVPTNPHANITTTWNQERTQKTEIYKDLDNNIIKTIVTTYDSEGNLISTNITQGNGKENAGTDSATNIIKNNNDVDSYGNQIVQGSGNPTSLIIGGQTVSNIERGQNIRYGNVSKVRMEIRYGTDDSVFSLDEGSVYIDYLKTPQHIRLTQEELDYTMDKSQMLEFPDYVCQEILNELVHIIMENISDQRLQTHPVVSQSIANPAQAQAPAATGQSA